MDTQDRDAQEKDIQEQENEIAKKIIMAVFIVVVIAIMFFIALKLGYESGEKEAYNKAMTEYYESKINE
ncbi:MAG: hypothetical protein IKU06_01815 [Lachnospiraceae bacterium]|nr:hypothetical protein [Lachnospiraceae bacterium]